MEQDECHLEKSLEEIENAEKEIDKVFAELYEASEWVDLAFDLDEVFSRFIENMESLACVFEAIERSDKRNYFLIGTLWSGVLGAYEGFVHDLFERLLKKEAYLEQAVKNVPNLSEKDKSYLRLNCKKVIDKAELETQLRRATLHEPNQIARLVNALFGISVPTVCKVEVERALSIRNAYIHNNGFNQGRNLVKLDLSSLKEFHYVIDYLISCFVHELKREIDCYLQKSK
ncbi:TPA: hypothetical protein ACGF1Q_003451 [Vibrio cholerae]